MKTIDPDFAFSSSGASLPSAQASSSSAPPSPTAILRRLLRDLPNKHELRYTHTARNELLEGLFLGLTGRDTKHLPLLFPSGIPVATSRSDDWVLSKAQGAPEGAEYSAAARGKLCGHIFRSGEATYRCKTCSLDETSVLCAKCFEASDHRNHSVFVSISPGNSGCCDCGDHEAWRRDVKCAIHTAIEGQSPTTPQTGSTLPEEVQTGIINTIGKALDFVCDVISCSPEQLKLPKTEKLVREDEEKSRLTAEGYEVDELSSAQPEFALLLWNDEKHTVPEVQNQVARACKQTMAWGLARAEETHNMGRSLIAHGKDVEDLLRKSKIIERIKLTVTVRSSRDTFREQMVGTIIEWLVDIAGCMVGSDTDILRFTICEQLLGVWNTGSMAWNTEVGAQGIDDNEHDEGEATLKAARHYLAPDMRTAQQIQDAEDRLRREEEGEEEEEEVEEHDDGDEDDGMDVDRVGDADGDVDMEVAGGTHAHTHATRPSRSASEGHPRTFTDRRPLLPDISQDTGLRIPATPGPYHARPKHHKTVEDHWLVKADGQRVNTPIYENLRQRVRLDWLILFDLRMWKKARVDLRELYIGTVVAIPQFKRILGLRFAGLYTTLSQLYLIADREPDHSIINLSLQMLTTPSITKEVVKYGNFLTNLMAILYTFLTTRQVGHPRQVYPQATLAFDAGSLTNRRMYHFFQDMRYLFGSDYVKERLRLDRAPMAQFLDLVRLHQGICPNIRAVGTHVEYESDAWICASLITREMNKLVRQFAEAFKSANGDVDPALENAIRTFAFNAIKNSIGLEMSRFTQAEIKAPVEFRYLGYFEMDPTNDNGTPKLYKVLEYAVDRQAMSFHHALHYALSWLIEAGKSMPAEKLKALLSIKRESFPMDRTFMVAKYDDPEDLIIALFDYPLRVFVWLSQMKAGMWVRNGFSLRHQMNTYKGVSQRDLTFYRDIFLLQVAMVTVSPSRMLLTVVDRFDLVDWLRGNYNVPDSKEAPQILDLAEDMVHLLIVLLSDRLLLLSPKDEKDIPTLQLKRELVHVLCSGAASFSDISQRIPERLQDLENFQEVLAEMTNYRPPDGLNDSGMYELKGEHKETVDAYILQYTKNQREEAELVYRQHMAKKLGIPEGDVIYEAKLKDLKSGAFVGLAEFTRTPLFTQLIYFFLGFGLVFNDIMPDVPATRIESYLHILLYLIQLAVTETKSSEQDDTPSFVLNAIEKESTKEHPVEGDTTLESCRTIVSVLYKLKAVEDYKSCAPKIDYILQRMRERRPTAFAAQAVVGMDMDEKEDDELLKQQEQEAEAARKKAMARQRQANIMAQFQAQQQSFLNNLGLDLEDDEFDDSINESTMEEDTTPEPAHPIWEFPKGNCILCQEETDESRVYGTFTLIKDSSIVRQTNLKDPDYIYEVATTPASLDRSADAVRPFGVAGMNHDTLHKLADDGSEITVERQTLGKGYPMGDEYASRGPVAMGCGHLMHFHCFENYCLSTNRRQAHQISRAHPERLDKKEFICPLCRALGNAFLPIVWKSFEEVPVANVVNTSTEFGAWLTQEIGVRTGDLDKSVSFVLDQLSRDRYKKAIQEHKHQFLAYGSSKFVENIASKLDQVAEPGFVHKYLTSESANLPPPTVVLPIGNFADSLQVGLSVVPPISRRENRPVNEVEEIDGIYRRLRDTLILNKIGSDFDHPQARNGVIKDTWLACVDTLTRTLGYTISATEIGMRGAEVEPGFTLLEKVSQQNLTHLRILSETIQAYTCISGLQEAKHAVENYERIVKTQMLQLFIGHPGVYNYNLSDQTEAAWSFNPLLSREIFTYLSEASFCLVPALGIEFKHVLTLCYIAEIVKVCMTLSTECTSFAMSHEQWSRTQKISDKVSYPDAEMIDFSSFLEFVAPFNTSRLSAAQPLSFPPKLIRSMLEKYLTTFLRKVMLLLHSRHGVYIPEPSGAEILATDSELNRLRKLLNLPDLPSIFTTHSQTGDQAHDILHSIIIGWGKHFSLRRESRNDKLPSGTLVISSTLSHPSILELVGLPLHYDTLVEEAMKRRCPNSGRELQDPVVCLFCGDIFCSQALCCQDPKDKTGGANQHVKKCGKDIGLFINIRKCHVLYLHNGAGAWAVAPYLDKHGEVDPNLRRNRQLFLNQKRYDAFLRTMWLQHQIPTVIARKLEPDFNSGGWDTL